MLKTSTPGSVAHSSQRKKYLVLFVLDGARPDYLSVPGIPHIDALVSKGTRFTNAWAGILESETPSGHAAIATGSDPNRDGILSFSWANSDNIPVNLFDPAPIRAGQMEHIMRASGAPTIASLVHHVDPKARVVALGGHEYYASDAIGGPDADVIMYYTGTPDGKFAPTFIPGHGPPASVLSDPALVANKTKLPLGVEDHLAMKLAVNTFNRMQQRVTLINLPEFDWPLGHVFGGSRDPQAVRTLMQGFDRDLGMLQAAYGKAGVLDRTEFVITADHGMSPIYHVVPKVLIEGAVKAAGTRVIWDAYHTGTFLWLKNESRAAAAAANIAKLANPYIQSVYFKATTAWGFEYVRATGSDLFRTSGVEDANQYLLRSFNGPNSPDLVVLFTEGAGSEPGGQSQWKGDHGGSSWESQHIPLVFSGPGVRRAKVSTQPARLMDIAPTALSLLGMPHAAMGGVSLADAMQKASAAELGSERRQGHLLSPVISALQRESRGEFTAGP